MRQQQIEENVLNFEHSLRDAEYGDDHIVEASLFLSNILLEPFDAIHNV